MKENGLFSGRAPAPSEGIALQKRLSGSVITSWDGRTVSLVAGADVHFPQKDRAAAAVVVMTFPGLETVETAAHSEPCVMPYIPGLLSFREIPAMIGAWRKLSAAPDLVLCDSHGIAHPRGLGMASHLGLVLGIPTIGCAKSHLFGRFDEPGPEKGDVSRVYGSGGNVIGAVLRTRSGTRPCYVSIGHLIDLETALGFVLGCAPRFRIPEPLRSAHKLAGAAGRNT